MRSGGGVETEVRCGWCDESQPILTMATMYATITCQRCASSRTVRIAAYHRLLKRAARET